MIHPTAQSPTTPATPSKLLIAAWLNRMDWVMALVRYTALHNAAVLLCLLWILLVPDTSMGLLGLVQQDLAVRRNGLIALFMAMFFMDIAQALRGLSVSWTLMTSLSGQCVIAIIATIYTLQGRIGFVGFYTHVGPFVLSAIGLLVAIQRAHLNPPWFVPRWMRQGTKDVMLSAISLLLLILAAGLLTRPDTNIAQFIQNRYGLGFFIVMIGVMLWGSGQLRHNHMKPWQALRRMLGIYLYSFMTMYLIATDNDTISVLSVYLALSVAALSMFFAVIQAQDQSLSGGAG